MAQSISKIAEEAHRLRFDTPTEPLADHSASLSALACVLAAERDRALQTIDEQRRAIVAMHERCDRYKAELEALQSVLAEIDDDSEARTEQLAALHLAVDAAEERALSNALRAADSEARLLLLTEEVERLRRAHGS